MVDKIKIQSPQQFQTAVGTVTSAMQIMGTFDWDHICQAMELGQGVGGVFRPDVKQQINDDPQWEQKKRIFRAARTFVAEVEAAAAEL